MQRSVGLTDVKSQIFTELIFKKLICISLSKSIALYQMEKIDRLSYLKILILIMAGSRWRGAHWGGDVSGEEHWNDGRNIHYDWWVNDRLPPPPPWNASIRTQTFSRLESCESSMNSKLDKTGMQFHSAFWPCHWIRWNNNKEFSWIDSNCSYMGGRSLHKWNGRGIVQWRAAELPGERDQWKGFICLPYLVADYQSTSLFNWTNSSLSNIRWTRVEQ